MQRWKLLKFFLNSGGGLDFHLQKVAEKFSACSLDVTCEPCIMCAAALLIIGKSICHTEIKLNYHKMCLFKYD